MLQAPGSEVIASGQQGWLQDYIIYVYIYKFKHMMHNADNFGRERNGGWGYSSTG